MNESQKKDLITFVALLVIVIGTFAGGVEYLRKTGGGHVSLLADAADLIQSTSTGTTASSASSTNAVKMAASSTPTSTKISTSTKSSSIALAGKTVSTTSATSSSKSSGNGSVTVITSTTKPVTSPATSTPNPSSSAPKAVVKVPAPSKPATVAAATTTPKTVAKATVPAAPAEKTIPYAINTFALSQGWQDWWGSFVLATDSLSIGASKSGTGGGVLLGNTNTWGDYTFNTTLDWVQGETFGLMGRYVDDNNYTACEFDEQNLGDVTIDLVQYVNGNENTLVTGDVQNWDTVGGTNIAVSMELQGTQGTCSFNNHVISNASNGTTLNPPYTGRVGFTTWDPDTNNSKIVVKDIDVEQNY